MRNIRRYLWSILFLSLVLAICFNSCKDKNNVAEQLPNDNKTESFNLNNSGNYSSHKSSVEIPDGWEVRVIDKITGDPIPHAKVVFRDFSDYQTSHKPACFSNGEVWIIKPTTEQLANYNETLNGNMIWDYSVTVSAEGYLPTIVNQARFPLTVKLVCGETVKVSGSIKTANGKSIPDATLTIKNIPANLWTNGENNLIAACEAKSDSNGHFEINDLAKNLDNVYFHFEHPKYAPIDFSNQLFNSYTDNQKVNLVLPELLEIKGRVTFSSGEPASNCKVFIDPYQSKVITDYYKIKTRSKFNYYETRTDSNGYFLIEIDDKNLTYGVKAVSDMHLPALAGLFSAENPPPEFIDLVIETGGASFCGRLSNTLGEPVTNVSINSYFPCLEFDSSSGYYDFHEERYKIKIKIDNDGYYVSQYLSPRKCFLYFYAHGYGYQSKEVLLRNNKISSVDVVFEKEVFNGWVYNADGKPISNVKLSCLDPPATFKPNFSPTTDSEGKCWIECKRHTKFLFSHPDYASRVESIYPTTNSSVKIYLSKKMRLIVKVNGLPAQFENRYVVRLHKYSPENKELFYQKDLFSPIFDGKASFDDIPLCDSPLVAKLSLAGDTSSTFSESNPIELKDGDNEASLKIGPMGQLEVNFTFPLDSSDMFVISNRDFDRHFSYSFWYIPDEIQIPACFEVGHKKLFFRGVPTNNYEASGFNYRSNIVIRSGETTYINIDNDKKSQKLEKKETFMIFGKTIFNDSIPVECELVLNQLSRTSYSGLFLFSDIESNKHYTLDVSLDAIGNTNFTINNVKASLEPLIVSLGKAYRITGTVVNHNAEPIKAKVFSNKNYYIGPGEFSLYPALPGTHTLTFQAENYAPIQKTVQIYDQNIDLGEICFVAPGFSIEGVAVDKDLKPIFEADVTVSGIGFVDNHETTTDKNGHFIIKDLAENHSYQLNISHDVSTMSEGSDEYIFFGYEVLGEFQQKINNIQSDINLNEVIVK